MLLGNLIEHVLLVTVHQMIFHLIDAFVLRNVAVRTYAIHLRVSNRYLIVCSYSIDYHFQLIVPPRLLRKSHKNSTRYSAAEPLSMAQAETVSTKVQIAKDKTHNSNQPINDGEAQAPVNIDPYKAIENALIWLNAKANESNRDAFRINWDRLPYNSSNLVASRSFLLVLLMFALLVLVF